MGKTISKSHDVVRSPAPDPEKVGYTTHNDPSVMPRSGPANTPGSDTNVTTEFSMSKGVPKGKTNVFQR